MTDDQQTLMGRRSLLMGAGTLAVSSLLGGCASPAAQVLQLLLLRGSIPQQFIGQFQKSLNQPNDAVSLKVSSQQQLQALFSQLQSWKRSPPPATPPSFWDAIPAWVPGLGRTQSRVADLMTLGDFWLEIAIRQGLLTPLEGRSLPTWATLSKMPQLQQLVTRNLQGQPDPAGKIWAVPYRLGTTVLAYRRDIFQQRNLKPPTDWHDLWRPDLRHRIGLLDNPREVIGLTLKKLGQSYNTVDLLKVPNLASELRALNQQAKYYSSTSYLQPLMLDDVWLAVAWSTDVLPLSQRSRQIEVVVPQSGTALFADLWVQPAMRSGAVPAAANQWIEFCWQQTPAIQLSLATWAVSPALIDTPIDQLPQGFRDYPALRPSGRSWQQSEFLLPIAPATAQQYRDLWAAMRQG